MKKELTEVGNDFVKSFMSGFVVPSKEELSQWAKEEEAEKKRLSEIAYTERKSHSEIPRRFIGCTFAEITKRGIPHGMEKTVQAVTDYALNFKANLNEGKGILMAGSVGRMKTTLACAVALAVMQQGYSAFFIPMASMLDRLLGGWRTKNLDDMRSAEEFEHRVKDSSLLILDDMGTEVLNDWNRSKMDEIITYRYNEMKPVIITSNLLPKQMKERYQDRWFDRVASTCLLIGFGGASLRREN